MSLRRQILLTVLLAMATALLPTVLILTWHNRQAWIQSSEINGQRLAQILALSASHADEQTSTAAVAPLKPSSRLTAEQLTLQRLIYRALDQNLHGIWLINKQLQVTQLGTIAGLGIEPRISAPDQHLVQQAMAQNRTQSQIQGGYLKVATPVNSFYEAACGAMLLYLPIAPVQANLQQQIYLALGTAALISGFGLLLSIELAKRLSHPIEQLRTAALAVASGNLDVVVEPSTTDEVGELALAFNQTTQKLKASLSLLENRVEVNSKALEQSEAHKQAILAAIPDLMFQLSADGTFLGYVNQSQVAALLSHGADPIGQPLRDLLPGDIAQRHLQNMAQVIATRCTQVYEQQPEINGQIQYEEVRVVAIDQTEALFIIRDIGDRKRAEAALQQSNQELATTLQALKTAQDDLIQSEKMAALGQFVAAVAHEINTPLGAIRSSISNISKDLEQVLVALPVQFQLLSVPEAQQFIALLRQSLDKPPLSSARDERQYRRALSQKLSESGIIEADKLAETLVIMGIYQAEPFTELLQKPDRTEIIELAYWLSGLQRSSHVISMATDRASNVVLTLKSYAQQHQTGEKRAVELLESINAVLTLYHPQFRRGVEVVRQFASIPPIHGYPEQLSQVWSHLIDNAIQAMKYHGILTIAVESNQLQVCITISDTGPGIPPELQAKIFQPFFTTKSAGEGSGLGLAVVQQIIETHQGQIKVESQPGQTRFHVTLPISANQPVNQPANRGSDHA